MPPEILAIIDKRLDTPTTADRLRVIVQQAYNFAIRKLLLATNPVAPPKERAGRNRRHEGAQWNADG